MLVDSPHSIVGGTHLHQHAAPAPRLQPRHNNLPPRNHDFVGREDELQRIHDLLSQGTAVALKPASVSGMGGVGKSQLAIEYAHRHQEEFDHVCWVDAEGEDIVPALARLASSPLALQLPVDAKTADIHHAVLARIEREGRHLLILDNVDHPKAWRSAIPTSGGVRVLITTRRSRLPGAETVAIEVLPRADALRLLRGDEPLGEQDEADANALCEELGDLALAIAVAGALLKSPFSSPGALLQEIRERGPVEWSEGQEHIAEELEKHPSLVKLFMTSIEQLDENEPVDALALAVFKVAGWLAPVDLEAMVLGHATCVLLNTDVDTTQFYAALGRVERLGLATSSGRHGLSLHQLLREFAQWLSGPSGREAMLTTLLEIVAEVPPGASSLVDIEPLRPHLEVATRSMTAKDGEALIILPIRLAQLLRHNGEYVALRSLIGEVDQPTANAPWRLYLLHELGQALHFLEDLEGAEKAYRGALSFKAQQGGEHSHEYATSLTALGQVLTAMERLDEAHDVLSRAVPLASEVSSHLPVEVFIALTALGQVQVKLRDFDAGRSTLQDALDFAKENLEEDHSELAIALVALGQAHLFLDQCGPSTRTLKRAVQIQELNFHPDHPALMDTLIELTTAYLHFHDWQAYQETETRVLASLQPPYTEEHRAAAAKLHQLGKNLYSLDKFEFATRVLQTALDIFRAVPGVAPLDTVEALTVLGNAHIANRTADLALPLLQEALSMRKTLTGDAPPLEGHLLASIGQCQVALGRNDNALAYLKRACASLTTELGPHHPDTRTVAADLEWLEVQLTDVPHGPPMNSPCPCGSGKKFKRCCGEIQPNAPCPCGSGRKFKRCCGRS